MPNESNRVSWIDEYKGFVLLLVCLFHVEQSFKSLDMGMLHLGAFRMSAFFFISGVLFSTRRFSNFRSYFIHKTKVLLIPYCLLSLIFLALDPVVYNFDLFPKAPKMVVLNTYPVIHGTFDYIYWNLAKIFIAGKSSIGSGPIWFVFTLYSISLLFFLMHALVSRLTKNTALQKVFVFFLAIACLAGGWALYKNHLRLPFGIERDLTTLFFFASGWLCKDFIKKISQAQSVKSKVVALTAAAISVSLYAYFEKPDPYFSIMNNDLGKSIVMLVASSFFGVASLVPLFMVVSQLRNKCTDVALGVLRNISRNAIIILAVHWWILLVLRLTAKPWLDKPWIAYLSFAIIATGVIAAIPLFRCKLHKVIAKPKITFRESLSIK